ncbi:nucleoside-diphosphate sugar epimerase/dehydratase, partial [uncultured Prochlorococcus sp.]|uniref:polysaccharide biosynthesis protein n=1 Tax=uncultured Prochlorococcus sp. TaxID=159733 RepID=UPI002584324E
YLRRFILIIFDLILIFLSGLFCTWIHTDLEFDSFDYRLYYFLLSTSGVAIFTLTNQYKGLTRFYSPERIYYQLLRNLIFVLINSFLFSLFSNTSIPVKLSILLFLVLSTTIGGLRIFLRYLINKLAKRNLKQRIKVAIYGAGSAAAQLASSLQYGGNYEILFFLDDNKHLWGRSIRGIEIKNPINFNNFKQKVEKVLLAIPSINKKDKNKIIERMKQLGVKLLEVPTIEEITSGKSNIDNLNPINIEDLLGRDKILPDHSLIGAEISQRSICVTGAGGSIGSELCKQIVKYSPKSLLLIDISEPNLYKIENELKEKIPNNLSVKYVLGDVKNKLFLKNELKKMNTEIIFHSAAYKHVPIVENNPIEGIENNVLTTKSISEIALELNIEKVILISTDKAVRPTNVMGASKRLAELIINSYSQKTISNKKYKTKFSMVRFGNVLGSSGSVVPQFRRQINSGGPITLTHKNVVRYFMTIQEAANLVLQASNLSDGGDLFLLDMGEPVKIKDLAEKMIYLSGLTLKDQNNPNGDIEIRISGLRKGEKLCEELLINNKSSPTKHPLIYKAIENGIDDEILYPSINKLIQAINKREKDMVLSILRDLVPEWVQSSN